MTLPTTWTSGQLLLFTELNENFVFLNDLIDLQPAQAQALADRLTVNETAIADLLARVVLLEAFHP